MPLYLPSSPSPTALSNEQARLEGWCRENGIESGAVIRENLTGRISDKQIQNLLSPVKPGDTVVVSSLSRLGRSINMLVAVMRTLYDRGVTVATLEGRIYPPDGDTRKMIEAMEFTLEMAIQIKARQSYDSANGKAGRPRGSKNTPEKTVLHGKTERLTELLSQGLSINKISKLLGVSRGTISNYLKEHHRGR